MMAAIPIPSDVQTSTASLGGIAVVNVDVAGADPGKVILYPHGGAYDLARRVGARLRT
jgi:acetyl esterase/lipase